MDACRARSPSGAKMTLVVCFLVRFSQRIESPVEGVGFVLMWGGERAMYVPSMEASSATAREVWEREAESDMFIQARDLGLKSQPAHGELRIEFSRCLGRLSSEQSCTSTTQGCLFIAQVAVTWAQVSQWKWNLEGSRFGYEY